MALVVAATATGGSSVWQIVVGGHRQRGIDRRCATGRRSSFLGDYASQVESRELGPERAAGRNYGGREQCVVGHRGGGRMFFIPLGPGGRRGTTWAGREWEKRNRAQQERLREMIDREMEARQNAREGRKNSDEFSLLRELEKRLRVEEAASAEDAAEAQAEDSVQGDGTKGSSEPSTFELMKELEKRLRTETESERVDRKSPRERRRSERGLMTGQYASPYEYMKEWDREMQERRGSLEELWKLRGGSRGEKEKRHRNRESWEEDSVKGETGGTEESRQKPDETDAAAAPKYPQSNGTVVYLTNEANGAELYLVGTSHVSQKSADEVREVIERVKPDFVMVELCRKRYESMKLNVNNSRRDNPLAFVEQIVRMLRNGNVGAVGQLVGVGLASFYRLLLHRGFHPGKEFQVAVEQGKKVGAKIVLGDQDIDTTLKHLGQFNLNMSIQDAFKFFGERMPDDVARKLDGQTTFTDMFERMRDREVVRRFNEKMAKGAPNVYKVLLTDRNEVMIKALRNLKGKAVAVVGLAHVDGLEQLWHQANEEYLSGLATQTQD